MNDMTEQLISPLRYDIDTVETIIDGEKYIILQDPFGIANQNLMLTKDFYILLRSLNGAFTFQQLKNEVENDEIYKLIEDSLRFLDKNAYLLSANYFQRLKEVQEQYSIEPYRPMLTANSSYPETANEFLAFASEYFKKFIDIKFENEPAALILPHIDFSIGHLTTDVYAKGYSSIAENQYDLFVIFGTSHRSYSDYFIFSEKPYQTPLGVAECDLEILNNLKEKIGKKLTIGDFSHKFEHSVEYQVVLLKYFFKNNFKILPILVGSPYEFIVNGQLPENDSINNLLASLNEVIEKSSKKVMFIASVDFAHIGRKFGDDFDAETRLKQLEIEDRILINSIERGDRNTFFDKIIADQDKWKICGVSSIYALMQLINPTKGKLIDYAIWNEVPTKSAVSFASIALFK